MVSELADADRASGWCEQHEDIGSQEGRDLRDRGCSCCAKRGVRGAAAHTMFHMVKKMGKVKPAPSKLSSSGVKAHLLKKFRPRLRASHVMVTKASTILLSPMSKSVSAAGLSMAEIVAKKRDTWGESTD